MKKLLTLSILLLQVVVLFAQEKNNFIEGYLTSAERKVDQPFLERFSTSERGNITFVANNILNRDPANTPYNGFTGNHSFNLQYIDIDGDSNTFSSSKSTLNLPNCSEVTYAGLYWAGIYPYDNWSEEPGANSRDSDFNKMKFKVPGGNYIDIVADKFDVTKRELIYDDGITTEKPYVCYKDVTTILQGLTDINGSPIPNGDYYGANIKATLGTDNVGSRLGSSAGWVLVVIYKNENESSKKFYLFDGFSTIKSSTNPFTDVNITGFQTVPSGPVRANLLVGALEGDRSISGDAFQIKRPSGGFETLTTGNLNTTNNFFNGSITFNNNHLTNRVPNSRNTLGFDVDLFSLNNPTKSILNNNQTETTLRFTTSGDSYWPFLLGMSVEIIEPKIQLIKTIEDAAGNPVPPNMGVDFGDEIFYSIKFQNVGTDNALNTELIDLLPKNVDLIESDIILPAGLTAADYTYTPPAIGNGFRGELRFNIPDGMVTENGAEYEIKLKVQVVSSCNDLRDVCSNVIMNQAFANYDSDEGGTPRVINEPSFSGIDACNLGTVGTSNFLIDTSGCTFERTQILCGANTDLVAGDGFASYSWVNANNLGTVIGTNQILTVTQGGTYIVTKTVPNNSPAGCVSTTETVHVTAFNTVVNPLANFADQVLNSCPNNIELAEIYLCGNAGTRDINLPFVVPPAGTIGTTVRWFELVSCPTPTTIAGCANVDSGCNWTDLGTDLSKTFNDAGQYKLEVLYDGQCPKTYYFNVYKATLNPAIVKEDLICGASADIVINNIPAGYEYSLTGPGGFNAPFQLSNTFTVTAPGDYDLSIRLANGSAATCTYTFPAINIQETTIDLDVITTNMQCANEPAQIRVQVSGAPGDYTYTLTQGTNTIATEGPTANNDYTFNVTDGGNYTVRVSTAQCTATEDVVINEPAELNLTAIPTKDISCVGGTSNGVITLNPSGGVLSGTDVYSFAIWSKDGVPLYANISDIPASAYFTNTTHQVINGQEGVYTFVVVDSNNCTTISTPVTINVEPELQFNHTVTNISCNGLTDGSINVNVVGSDLGFSPIEYSINGAGGPWNTTGVFNNLSANPNYTVTIRASKTGYQCAYEITNIGITEPLPLNGGDVVGTNYECNTAGNTILGTLTFTPPTGGTGAYTYYYKLDSDPTFIAVTGTTVSGLVAGTYNVKAEDARGCERNLTDVVIDPIPGAPTLNHSIEYNCEGEGTITVTPFNAAYTYTLDGGTPQTGANANIFVNTAIGSHTIRVNYFGNCRLDLPVTVQPGNIFSGSIDSSSDSECFGADNGTISIAATNVVGTTFEYSTDGGTTWSATSDNPYRVIGLAADTYNVFIRETDGGKTCVIDLGNVVITQPDELTLSASATQIPTCVLPSTGTITAVASGGVPPYEFSIDNGTSWQSSPIFSNVPARATDYIVMIRDSRNCNECGCTSNLFENGSFEQPARAGTTFSIYNENSVPGWDSTANDNRIEIWYNNFNGVPAHNGVAHAELNANLESSLFQEYCTQPGDVISWSVAHRGRRGTDVATVKIGDDLATASVVETMSDGTSAWGVYSGTYTVPVGQSTTVIAFDAVSTAGGNISVGNFIDDVKITIARNNCIPVSIPLIEPTPVAFTVTPEVCFNGTNGTLTVNVTSGNGNYLYSLDGGTTTQTSNVFTGLTAGTYNVTVTDGLSCTIPPVAAIINEQITATVVPTNEICNTLGVITITPGGGDGNYQYVVTPVAPTVGAVITTTTSPINVSAGTYSVSVRDQGGAVGYCEYSENVTITRIVDPTVVVTAVQPDCSGGTGTVNIAISNGTSNYTTTLTLQGAPGTVHTSGPSSDAAISFGTLAEGTYDVLVTDANGCTNALPETVTITAPNAITGDSRQSQDYTCLQLGEITVENVVGGTPPYTYTLSDGTTTTTHTTDTVTFDHVFTGLTDGSYTVTISDVNTCNFVTTPTVVIPALPTAPGLTSAVAYNCDGTGNITITALPAGVYNYTLGATTNTTGIFNDLSDGTYTVTVDYGSDCTVDVVNITILDNQEFTAVVTNQTNPVCIGDTNGTIEVTASFPSTVPTDFDYSLDGGGTWIASGANPFTIPNLDNITYNILVKPTGAPVTDCNITLDPVVLSDPSPIVVAATVTKDITCDADPTLDGATITITPTTSGGNGAAYTYELFDNATATGAAVQVGAPFTDIDIAGDYWVVAIDVESCRSTPVLVNVPDKAALAFTVTPEVCYDGTNGTLTVNITTGNGNYLYSLDGGTTTQASNVFTGLTDGTYNVTVIDGFECTTTESATINEQITATVVPTNEICNTLGVITITPGGGDGNYQYVVTPVAPTVGAVITTTTSPINVSAGTYSVSVRDQGGAVGYCEYSENVTITRIVDPTVVVTAVQPDCSGGTGTVNIAISNGTSNYTTTLTLQGAPGTVHTSGPSSDAAISFGTLAEGTYDVLVTDVNGCTNALPETVTITAPNAITGDSRQSQDYTCLQLGEITVENVVGGTPPYTYTLSDGTTTTTHTTDTVTFDHVFTGLTDGSYTVTISDVNTCNFVTTPTVVIPALPTAPGLTSAVAYNCDGTGNITITALPAGVYNYTLGATTNTTGIFNDLSDGTYTVTVDYGSDCTVDVVNITILDNQEFTAVVTNQTNPVCIGDTNGTIEVTASFPSTVPTDFDYSLDGGGTWIASGANPFTIPNLDNITYNILVKPTGAPVTDCNITLDPVVLSDPSPIVVAATVTKDITCDADPTLDGATITITPTTSGGNGAAYTYELFDNATATGAAVQVGAPFTDIDIAGDYWVVAIDVESCRSTPVLVNVPDKAALAFTVTPEVCYDGTNGTLTVNITTGNGNYLYSLDGGTTTQASNVFTGLTDGTYNVTVIDGFECTTTESATINEQITATVVPTNEICNTLGVITITPGGGDGNYQYVVTPVAPTVGAVITTTTSPINVSAGTYSVSVRDQGGAVGYCEYSENVTITRIVDPTVVVTAVQPDCSGGTGTVNIAISNGTSNYTTTLTLQGAPGTVHTSGPSSDAAISFGTLAEGTYDVLVTDANGCTNALPETVTITAPNAITGDSRQSQDYTCLQLGEITVENVVGGTPPYTYTLSDGTTTTTHTTDTVTFDHVFTGLTDGSYTVTISDVNTCNFVTTPTVVIPALPTAPGLTSAVAYNCDGTGNITITALPAGVYNYTLGATTNTTGIFNDLSDGTYTVTVDYGSDCTVDVVNITILDNQEFTAVVTNQTNPVCIGDTNGTIEVTASFPSTVPTDFDYSLDGGGTWIASGANPFTIPNLDNITYNILVKPTGAPVTDCNITLDPVVLSDPSPIVVAATVTKDITCDADPTLDGATITITPTTSGGNGAAYTYELFDNATATGAAVQVGAPFTDIDTAGDYWVVAIDVESCRSTPVLVNVPVRETIVFTAVPQCYDGANGVIDINITSGNGTYEFSLDGTTWQTPTPANATSFSITGLSNIAYTVEIRDIKGCTQTENVTINNALVATATPTNASCIPLVSPTGQIEVFPAGGSTIGYEFSVVTDGSAAGVFSATNPITNLAAGTYDVYVRDDANCEFIIQDVVIEQITPVAITITGNQPTCNGDTGSIDGVITANTGQSPHTITIADSGGVIAIRTLTGFVGTNFSFNNLPAETYTVAITDNLGCTDSQSVTLVDPQAIVMDIAGILPPGCAIDPSQTGFNFINIDPNDYLPNTLQYSIDNGTSWVNFTATGGQIRGLNSGDKVQPVLQTIDGSGNTLCLVAYGEYEIIYNVTGLIVDPVANPGNCAVGFSVTVEALGGSPLSTFEFAINTPTGWVGPDALNNGTLLDPDRTFTFTGLTPGLTYEFFVRDTTTGCIQQNNEDLYVDYTPSVPITSLVNNQSCFGSNAGQITFSISNPSLDLSNNFTWTLYERDLVTNLGAPVSAAYTNVSQTGLADIIVTGLAAGNYYIVLTNDIGTCDFGSTDVLINVGTEITGTLNPVTDITCNVDGVVRIENVTGGFGGYTYEVTSITNTTIVPPITIAAGVTTFNVAYTDVIDPALPVNITIGVTDINGCTTILTPNPVVLNVSDSPIISLDAVSTCDVNKTITVSAAGGLAPYQYSINGGVFSSPTATPFVASGLAAGSYDITVRDSNGCTDVLNNTVIHESIAFDAVVTLNAVCTVDGQVTLTINSGSHLTGGVTADYSYSLDGNPAVSFGAGNTTAVLNLAPATYTVSIVDNNTTCVTPIKSVNVLIPAQPVFTTNVVDATCNGGANGSIGVSVTAGLTPYTYSIVQTAGTGLLAGQATWDAASSSFIAVPAGTYTVTVTGDNGCSTDELNVVVDDNDPLTVTAPLAVQFACAANTNNVQNATLSINALDGSGVSGGSTVYSTVRLYHDVLGDNPADNSTNRTDDVEITTVSVTGTDHVFSITDVAGGSYYVEVVDSASCMSLSGSTAINAFDAITDITITQAKAIDCTTGDNITVKTLTDIANVTYNIISAPAGYVGSTTELVALGTSSASFTDLPTGTYEITATHPVTGCVFTKEYTVDAEPAFTAIANNPQTTCFGVSGGSIDVSFDVSTPYTLGYDYEVLTSAGASLVPAVTGSGVGNVTETIAGLAAGTYYVSINMSPNTPFCTIQTNEFTIVEPTAILSVTGLVDPGVSCTGISDATITATGAAGFGGYTYQLEVTGAPNVPYRAGDAFATNTNNNVFTGLPAGNYTIRVRDVNGCEGSSADVVVAAPVAVTFGVVELDNSCDTSVGGSIAVTAAGGTGSYTYVLTNGAGVEVGNTGVIAITTHTFANLSAEDYTVSVTDSNGCAAPAGAAITISEDLVFSLATTKDLTCSAPMAGTVVITVASGSNNYTYEVAGPVGFTAIPAGSAFISGQTFSPTVAGTYTVTVTDEDASPAACPVVRTIDIAAALQPVFTTNVVDATCNGGANGSIGVSVTAGLTPYTYSIVQTAGTGLLAGQATWDAASSSFIAVPAGTYTVTVTGDNGCSTDELNVVVDDNDPLTVTAPLAVQFACAANTNNVQNATLSINALDGSGVSGGSTVYSTVRLYHDVLGDNPADNSTNRTDDVEITTVSVTGTDHVFSITDVAGGSYYVEVVDSASCMSLSGSTAINAFDAITDITITQAKAIDCTTGDNITVKTLTDIANVTYNIISAPAGYVGSTTELVALGTSSASFTDLPTGTYEITATHPVTGCVFTKEYTVDAEPAFTAIANNPQTTCFGVSGGSIDVSFDVSTPYTLGYDYEVLTSAGASLVPAVTGSGVGNVTETIAGLAAGTYYVSINMSPNTPFCTIQTNEFTIVEPTAILSVTGLVDPGVSCTGISDATITATGAAGFGGYTYQLEVTGAPNVPYRAGDAFATNTNNNVFTGLPAGNYTIRVRDVNGCEGSSADVVVAAPVAVTFGVVELDNSCDTSVGGSIAVTAAGGTGSYTYVLTNGAGVEVGNTGVIAITTHTFANLSAEDYTVSVTDSNGCAAPAGAAITISEDLVFSLATTKDLTCSAPMAGTVVITVASGSNNYTYEVAGPVGFTAIPAGSAFISGQTFSPTVAGTYTVTVTDEDASPAACPVVRTIDIAAALQPVFTTNVVDATCNGGANGSIGVSVTAGLTPYTYSIVQTAGTGLLAGQATWDAASSSFIAVPAGTYTVTVTGDNGCSTDELNVVVNDNPLLTVTAPTAVQFACAANTNNVQNATLSIDALDGSGVSGGSTVYSTVRLYHDVNGDNPADNSTNRTDDIEVTTVSVTGTDHVFIITDVAGGSYYVEVVDNASCMSLSGSTTINAFDAITDITITQAKAIDCTTGDNITVKTLTDIANVTYNIISAPAGYVGSTTELVALGTSSASFTDLPTGTYEITATHPVTGCVFTKEYTVDAEPAFTAIANNPQTTCFGVSGGSIDVSFDVSTPYTLGYDYEVLTSAGASLVPAVTGSGVGNATETIAGLPAGTYYVSINMSPNTPFCTIQTNEFTIVEPAAILSVSGIVDPGVSCTGISDATITATGAAGFGGYTYQLEVTGAPNVPYRAGDAFATNLNNNVFTGLPAGNYTIRVRDVNGCEGSSADVVVAAPVAVTFGVVELDNSCDTSVGGSIAVTAAGGTGSYTYVLTNGAGVEVGNTGVIATTTHTFANLSAEDYTVSVTDSNGCAAPAGAAITISEDLVFSLATTKDLTCSAPMAGTVVITVASGSNNYTYEVAGPVGFTAIPAGSAFISGQTFSPTVAGTYTVTVTDEDASPAACPVVRTIDIAVEKQPIFTATAVIDDICNGSSDGAISMTPVNNGISPLTYTIAPIAGTLDVATSTFEDLPAGIYTITATGTNGCSSIRNVTITENADIDISGAVTISEFGCTTGNETNNAVVSVNTVGVGGTGNFVRAVFVYDNGTPGDTTDDLTQDSGVFSYTVTNEVGGQITVTVFDDNNCSDTIIRTINPFARITGVTVTSQKAIDCNNGEDIIATYTSTIAIANVEYRLYNDTTGLLMEPIRTIDGDFISLLATGNYRIEIENTDTNCVFTEYYTVDETPEYELIVNNIQRACSGGNGSVDLIFNPSTPYVDIYSYEVFNVGGVTTGQIGNGIGNAVTTINTLPEGDYYIVVNMPNTPFCTVTSGNFTVEEPDTALTLSEELTYLKCNILTSGEVDLTAQGGWGAYEYELINTTTSVTIQNFGNNNVITGLEAGNYQATVRDANNCREVITFQLDPGTTITGSYTVTPNDCIGEYTATIEAINVLGGQLQDAPINYMYALEYPDGTRTTTQASPVFANLSAGVGYSVIISDGYSCDGRVGPIDIVDPTKTVASANITADITCNRAQATVEVSGSGGTGPYEFSIDGVNFLAPNAGLNYIFSVDAGEHNFYVRDTESCISDPRVITINSYAALTATLDTASAFITCNGDANAVLSANAENGLGNYEYQLLDGSDTPIDGTWQTSNSFSNLDVGTYKINVRSTKGLDVCTTTTGQHTITQPLPLIGTAVATQNVTCFGTNTGIITATGQDGNGDYEFNIVSEPSSPEYPENKYVKNGVFENLAAGVYWVTVKDIIGCVNAPIRVEIIEPDELEISLVSIAEQTCLSSPTPIITVDVQGGTQPYFISINNVELATPFNQNQIAIGAAAGIQANTTYLISVRDSGGGCPPKSIAPLTTIESVDLELTVDFEYTCPTGNIIKAIVADKYKNNMSYSLYLGGTLVTTNTTGEFIDVAAGNGYTVTATDTVTSCSESLASDPIDIEDIQALTMTIDDSQKNKLIANVDFGLPPYSFTVDGVDYEDENEIVILQTKDYTITVTDARGCEVTMTVRGVYVTITVLNLFTPDGDGVNDFWYPLEVENYHNLKVYIFDRYAREITKFRGMQQGWDGTYDGKPLPAGDYWYTLYYNELSGEEKKLMGHFTLYR